VVINPVLDQFWLKFPPDRAKYVLSKVLKANKTVAAARMKIFFIIRF
jgi:hypothetical protein